MSVLEAGVIDFGGRGSARSLRGLLAWSGVGPRAVTTTTRGGRPSLPFSYGYAPSISCPDSCLPHVLGRSPKVSMTRLNAIIVMPRPMFSARMPPLGSRTSGTSRLTSPSHESQYDWDPSTACASQYAGDVNCCRASSLANILRTELSWQPNSLVRAPGSGAAWPTSSAERRRALTDSELSRTAIESWLMIGEGTER